MFDPVRLVFTDETAASTKMVRLRGRCPRGERLVGSVPHGHWKTITLVAGLRHDAIVAPFVIDGPLDGKIFRTYVERCLAPTLDRGDSPGIVRSAALRRSALSLLKTCSTGLRSGKIRRQINRHRVGCLDRLWRRIRSILRTVSKQECLNFSRHAGYE